MTNVPEKLAKISKQEDQEFTEGIKKLVSICNQKLLSCNCRVFIE